MTPSLPRTQQIGSRQVAETLRKLAAEVGGLKAFEPGVREAIGNTNWTVLMQRLDEAEAALSPLPSSSGTGWRSIETAPHGVEVLLATPPFRCMGEQARWEMRVGCASWGERIGGFSNRSQDAYATHWLPLPAAPVSHGGGRGE